MLFFLVGYAGAGCPLGGRVQSVRTGKWADSILLQNACLCVGVRTELMEAMFFIQYCRFVHKVGA